MNAVLRRSALALLWAAVGAGCASGPAPVVDPVPPTAAVPAEHLVYANTGWSGDVLIERPIIVARTATLTLAPGTRVYFRMPPPEPGRDPQPWITVQGGFVAAGTAERPVSFQSAEPYVSEGADMIYVEGAKEVQLRACRFERGPWALHAHDTPVTVEGCEFRDNFGGVRFQGGSVTLRRNRFLDNRIGVRCLKASPTIEENTFSGNLTGIFFRQEVQGALVRRNNFDNLEYDVKLGEEQIDDVMAAQNWWKAAETGRLAEAIYDVGDTEGLGRVVVRDPLPAPWTPPTARP